MSVSEMNMTWSTMSGGRSFKSQSSSVFLTSDRKTGSQIQQRSVTRPKCVSAKISGMRFQSWREPKPLRSRCGSAVQQQSTETNNEDNEKPQSTSRKTPKSSPRRNARLSEDSASSTGSSTGRQQRLVSSQRLSQPTQSSKHRASVTRPREANVDMNWYSWSKMNVYKDYQAVIYKDNGTLRPKSLGKAR